MYFGVECGDRTVLESECAAPIENFICDIR